MAFMASAHPVFTTASFNEFHFDTGVLRGTLRASGKSLGLTSVYHIPTGKRLDRSNGLLSHYRVFANGIRLGGGAWDWPSQARLLTNGSVEVLWPATDTRPFEMRAVYNWLAPTIIDVDTIVLPKTELKDFESFLASYFSPDFTNAEAYVRHVNGKPGPAFLAATESLGTWLMFPVTNAVVSLIKDGRWTIPPNPVDWTIMSELSLPIAFRRAPASGLTAVLMSPGSDCFAIACPHQTESHYSMYFSLFGRTLKPGETARAKVRLMLAENPKEDEVLEWYSSFVGPRN